MKSTALEGLPWLPRPPQDFRSRCRSIDGDGRSIAAQLRALAGHALGDGEMLQLARAATAIKAANDEGRIIGLRPYTLAILSNGTTSLLAPALVTTALRYGIDLRLVESPFDQVMQLATAADSLLRTARPDGIVVALDHRGVPGLEGGLAGDEEAAASAALGHMAAICHGLRAHTPATLFVQNVACPSRPLFGSLDPRAPGTQWRRIDRLNRRLNDLLDDVPGVLFDVDAVVRAVGAAHWFDERQWHLAKLPFAQECVPLYADHLLRLVAASVGMARKCLVLDLDNTLWGGEVGDDGMRGLVLGQGDAVGEAFVAVQQAARWLHSRGVLLAVCSKNDDAVARAAFRDHPDMLLRLNDIAVFQCNWQDKATNLRAIAAALSLGTDSLVFLDDNPAERALVRAELPEVAVPELPADPADYPAVLLAAGYFETLGFTAEDRQRAGDYQANARRAVLAASCVDMHAYLESLDMTIHFAPFDAVGRARIAQLVNRSNQFNLTTRRHDEAAIAAFESRNDAFTLQVRLADRFGDNGMIGVVICTAEGTDWVIDTWLMSCRVLNRRVEEAVLDMLAECGRALGVERLVGLYIPTDRNGMVRDHYARLGFRPAGTEHGIDRWLLDLATAVPRKPPLRVEVAAGIHAPGTAAGVGR
jgi:FkbH-like protein